MKKIYQMIGILTLLIVSFTYNEEVKEVVKISDTLLQEIRENEVFYNKNKIESTIINDTIIPGINGKKVNINKSYNNMKELGYFDENRLIYKTDKIKEPLENHKNKFIVSGNKNKKQIALIFKVSSSDNLMQIMNIFTDYKATFFMTSTYAKHNISKIKKLIIYENTIGNLSSKQDYIWLKTLIKQGKQKNNYCIVEKMEQERLNECASYGDYTVVPQKYIKDQPLLNIKKVLCNGAMIYVEITKQLQDELPSIIKYITSKGYEIVSLESLLKE